MCKRAVHERLTVLVKKGYLNKEVVGYSLTDEGYKLGNSMKDKVKNTSLRTNPRENENMIIEYIKHEGLSYRNKIARELKINPSTVRLVLNRLIDNHKIKFVAQDKFQRKFYKIRN